MSSNKSIPVSGQSDNTGYNEPLYDPLKGVGTITSGYGARKAPTAGASTFHKGIDIAASTGTPVYAAQDGVVEVAGQVSGYGNYIKIRHDSDTETGYGHLSSINVSVGQRVVAGEIIGKVGSTGVATGPHLHYEVWEDGKTTNPNNKTIGVNTNDQTAASNKKSNAASAAGQKEAIASAYKERTFELKYNQDEILRKILAGDYFQDNPANEIFNLTYHWRFFVTNDTDFSLDAALAENSTLDSFYSELNKYEQIILAETGVTGMNIDSVNMNAIVGTDFQTSSTLFTNLEMKITEPNGVLFLDSLRNAALKLNIRNYQKTFYYLELTFKGYDEDGNINLSPFADLPNGGKWIWSVVITDIQVAMNAGGGTYTLQLTPLNDSLSIGKYNLVPSTVSVSGGTVGEIMDALCKGLNNFWDKMKGAPNIITYEMKFHPVEDLLTADEVRALSAVPVDVEHNEERSIRFEADGKTATIERGRTISQVLDTIMTTCEAAQQLAIDTIPDNIVDSGNNQINSKGYRQSILWRVEPEVHYTDYDPLFNDYCRKFIIHVYGFRNHATVLSPVETRTTEEIQKAVITDLAYRNFMPKKYEYLFTGNNSEVLDLDLNFNLKWAAVLPRLIESSQEQVEVHAKALPQQGTTPTLKRDDTQKSPGEIAANASGDFTDYVNKSEEYKAAKEKHDRGEMSDEDFKNVVKEQQAARDKVYQNRGLLQQTRADLNAARPNTKPSKSYERAYGEDLTNTKSEYDNTYQYKETFPVTIETFDPDAVTGATGQYHAGKSVYGSVLNQAYGPLTDQFFQIDITIRGDPFWIGAGSFEQAIVRKSDTFTSKQPNFSQGVNTFLLKFMYPLGQDDNGDLQLNVNETVTGVYQVNKITHRFEDGKFTQVLSAYRIPLIDTYKALYKQLYTDPNSVSDGDGGENKK